MRCCIESYGTEHGESITNKCLRVHTTRLTVLFRTVAALYEIISLNNKRYMSISLIKKVKNSDKIVLNSKLCDYKIR